MKKICIVCGKEFETLDKRKTKCSKECIKKYLSQKKKENWQNPEYKKQQSEKIRKGQNNPISKYKMSIKKKGKPSWSKGIHKTKEQKEKQSKSMMGHVPWNKGKTGIYTQETREKISIQVKKSVPRAIETKRKNKSFNISQEEEKISKLLFKKFIKIKRQYRSKKYPFACDFYIPKLDLYIEYQGFWSHGDEPYDSNNINHNNIIKAWGSRGGNFYNLAIETWTKRDPLKRETAKKNNLNWIEFFTMDQFMEWYNKQ